MAQSVSPHDPGTTPESPTRAHDDLVQAAREWVLDCMWKEDPEDIEEMSDWEILHGVEHHYDGGLAQLAQDAFLDDAFASWKAMNGTAADEGWAR